MSLTIIDTAKTIFDAIFAAVQNIANTITSFFDMFTGVIDFVIQIITAVAGIFKWMLTALDLGREFTFMLPWDLATVFAMMTIVSVVFVIFGRVK